MNYLRPTRLVGMAAAMLLAVTPALGQATTQVKLYFGRGMTTLGYGAPETLDELVNKELKVRPYSHVLIDGYTDTGTPSKQAVAITNAMVESTRKYLVAHGVDAGAIRTKGWGATHLAVQTSPNVFEPLNRRVEIIVVWK